jgi:hypothetical protein
MPPWVISKSQWIIGTIIYGSILFVILSFCLPIIIDAIDYIEIKRTYKKNPHHPLYEEMHQIRYAEMLCGGNNSLASTVKKYIPLGTSQKAAFEILKRNGYKAYHKMLPAGRVVWPGGTFQRRYEIYIDFKQDKVINIFVETSCAAL